MIPFLRVALLSGLGIGFFELTPHLFPPRDFLEYWTAAKVLANGGNPYDGDQILAEQRRIAGHSQSQAVSLWTPPWTLPLYLPFGYFPYEVAHRLWLQVQLLCFGITAEFVTRRYRLHPALGYLALIVFSPVFWDLHFGQNTAFILLGLAGFVRFRETRPILAGMFVALTAIKPHLLAPFGTLLILDAATTKGRHALWAGIATLEVGASIAFLTRGTIFWDFYLAATAPSTSATVGLKDWNVPVGSYHLRQLVDPSQFWIQFLPCLQWSLFAAIYYCFRWKRWNWANELPRLVVLSLLVAPYGGWIFDLTLLLVPLLAGAKYVLDSKSLIGQVVYFGGLAAISAYALKFEPLATYWWVTPAFTALYLLAEFTRKDRTWRTQGS